MAKDAQYNRLIQSKRWRTLRKVVLTAHPVCENCRRQGLLTAAREIHHITPVETGLTSSERERLMFSLSNLTALCHNCHVAAHVALKRSGKAVTQERNHARAEMFHSKYFE